MVGNITFLSFLQSFDPWLLTPRINCIFIIYLNIGYQHFKHDVLSRIFGDVNIKF